MIPVIGVEPERLSVGWTGVSLMLVPVVGVEPVVGVDIVRLSVCWTGVSLMLVPVVDVETVRLFGRFPGEVAVGVLLGF